MRFSYFLYSFFYLLLSPVAAQEFRLIKLTDSPDSLYYVIKSFNDSMKYSDAADIASETIQLIKMSYTSCLRLLAETRYQCGFALFQLGKYEEVIELITRALEIQQSLLPENHCDLINSLRLLGLSYMKIGKYPQSVSFLEKCRLLAEHDTIISIDQYAEILNKLGQGYTYLGDYKEAIPLLENSLSILLGSTKINQKLLSKNYQFLGICYKNLKQFDLALSYYDKAFPIYVKLYGLESRSMAFYYSEIGQTYLAKRDFTNALEYFKKSNSIMIEVHEDNTGNYGWVCVDIGKAQYAIGNYSDAVNWFTKAITIFRIELKYDNLDIADFLILLGRAQTANCQFRDAFESFDQNIKILSKLYGNDSYLLHYAHSGKANVYKKWYIQTGQDSLLQASRYFYQLAESGIKNQLQKDNFTLDQKKVMADAVRDFENAINAELLFINSNKNNPTTLERAWQYSESMHNFLLFSACIESNARHFAGIPDEELKKDSLIQIQITNLQIERKSLLEEQKIGLTDTLVLTQNALLYAKEKEQNNLRDYFNKNYPDYSKLKYQLQSSSIEKTQMGLSSNQTLLEYFTGDSSIFIFVVQKNNSKLIEINLDFPLNDWVQSLVDGITTYHTSSQKNAELYKKTVYQYAEAAFNLNSKLIKPVSEFLTSELIIVPDGVLANLPFEALLTGVPKDLSNFKTYPYLINTHAIQYAYSATMLHQMIERKHSLLTSSRLLAFAPFYDIDTASIAIRLKNEDALRYGLSALPYSGEEVYRAKSHFNNFSEVLTGKSATKKKFKDLAAQYKIIHLATHGQANHKDGDFSFLAFSDAESYSKLGLMTVAELYNLQLNADLVILSACETATGQRIHGEGVISLARAFAYAGAKSIVASLWKVNDKSTMQIMDNFYKELKEGKSKNISLALAKKKYLFNNPGQISHPFFWAGFISVGDMSILKIE